MKKRVAAAVLAGVMALSLTACGGSSDSKTEAKTEEKTEETAENDTDAEEGGEEETGEASDMKVAMVTDSGDITDQSFNQTTYETCKAWGTENNVEF